MDLEEIPQRATPLRGEVNLPDVHPRDVALLHLLEHVLGAGDGHQIRKAIQYSEVDDILEFMTLDSDDIKELSYLDDNNEEQTISKPNARKLKKLLQFSKYMYMEDDKVEWQYLTSEDLEHYMADIMIAGKADMTQTKQLARFTEGVKLDVKAYPVWNGSPTTWLTFKRKVLAVAQTHQLSEVFDPEYVKPTVGTPARELYNAKNEFVYAMWTARIQDGGALTLIRTYAEECDGASVYAHLIMEYESQHNLDISAIIALNGIQSLKLNYKGTTAPEYISKFRGYLLDLIDAGQPLADSMARTFVISQIQDNAYTFVRETALQNPNMDHEQIFSRLLDKYNQGNTGRNFTARQANNTSSIQRNGGNKGYIPPEKWKRMSDQERKAVIAKRNRERGKKQVS